MKRISMATLTFSLMVTAAASLAGCDEDKKKADLLAKAGATDAASGAVATADAAVATPTETPSASASASSAPKKDAPIICPTGPELTISDRDVEAQIRLKLAKPTGPLKVSDLANVKSLDLTKKKELDELDPCVIPKMTGLHHLYLGPGKLRDLKPIANLIHLESLRASINEVEDLKPLEKLTQLDVLDLGRTHVRDLAPLAVLVNLTELQLDNNQITDLTPLAKMKKLQRLSIRNTPVTDISPLKTIDTLKSLDITGCAISNLDTIQPNVGRGLKILTK